MIEGLKTTTGEVVPLLGVQVEAEVVGAHTRVKVRQRYQNAESKPIEAVYTFPLPSDATISGFAMVCNGRKLEGIVQEKEQAFRTYDEALTQGHGAALLEQERKNVFTANVGNLLPKEETLIEVEYLQKLTADEGALRWMLPTLVAPRYIPGTPQGNRTGNGWAEPTDAVPDADRITPRIGEVHYGLALSLTFDVGADIEVESPSHKIATEKKDGKVRVSFQQQEVALDRDIVVIARGAKGVLAGVAAHREGDQPGFFSLTVVPDLFEPGKPPPSQEVVFLVDTSGSMDGESLPQAKAALKLCLRHLREGDRFNIIQFNSNFSSYVSSPTLFSQKTLQAADKWVDKLRADGGTELLGPMVHAVAAVPNGVVVLLTDGQVGNEAQILDAVLKARKSTRVYSFGIGTNVSDQLLRDLARQTEGAVEFIHPGERIDEKVTAQFAKAIADRVTNIELKWVGLAPTDVAPGAHLPMVDGEPWTLFGRYTGYAKGHVEIFGKRGGQPFTLQVPAEFPEHATQPALRPLWAAERIADWETAGLKGRRADLMKERITKLAVEFGVSSPYTSFVVVEKREGDRLANGQPETRFVPVNTPAGWDMFNAPAVGGFGAMAPRGMPSPASVAAPMRSGMAMPPMAPPPAPRMSPAPSAPVYDAAESTGEIAKRSRAAAPAAKGGGGILDKMKKMFEPAPPPAASAPEEDFEAELLEAPEEEGGVTSQSALTRLFEQQLASGLWDGGDSKADAHAQLKATVQVLQTLLRDGVTTTHPVFGGQVRKAIEALVQLVAQFATKEQTLVEQALALAWLLASGQRTRAAITKAAQPHPALLAKLADEAALRAEVERMTV